MFKILNIIPNVQNKRTNITKFIIGFVIFEINIANSSHKIEGILNDLGLIKVNIIRNKEIDIN